MQKRKPFKSKKLLNNIRHIVCVRCGADDGTVVGAHYSGIRQHGLGKGVGMKPTDAAVAALCYQCHCHMDQYKGGQGVEHSEEFLYYVVLTHEMMLKQGLLEVVNGRAWE